MITHEINYSNPVLREYLDKLHDTYRKNNEFVQASSRSNKYLLLAEDYPRLNFNAAIKAYKDAICCIKTALQIDPLVSNERLREIVNSLGKDHGDIFIR